MSYLFPDIVTITPISDDPTFGNEVEGKTFTSKAQVEWDSEIKYSGDGAPIDPEVWIMLPAGTSIVEQDKIAVTKLHGRTPTAQEARTLRVKRAHPAGGFKDSHIEVLC